MPAVETLSKLKATFMTLPASAVHPMDDDVAQARRRIGPLRWLSAIVLAAIALQILAFLLTNPRFEWPVVMKYLFADSILKGLGTTLALTAIAMILGTLIGTLAALALLSDFKPG